MMSNDYPIGTKLVYTGTDSAVGALQITHGDVVTVVPNRYDAYSIFTIEHPSGLGGYYDGGVQGVMTAADQFAPWEPPPAPEPDPADVLLNRALAAEKALADLKRDVALKVRELTVQHGWCNEAENALAEVGIDPISSKYTITVDVEVTTRRTFIMHAELLDGNVDPVDNTNYVLRSLDWDNGDEVPTLDGDWDMLEAFEDTSYATYGDPSFTVSNVELAED